jgi:hypothetical protein
MDWARKMPRSKTHMAKEFAEFLTSADQSRREQQVELARHAIGLTALPDEVTEWPGYMRRALPLPKYGT